MTPAIRSRLYAGTVRHRRQRPARHEFRYRVYYGLFDLDELETLDGTLRWFSHNRFNLYSLYDRDHGPDDGTNLRSWINGVLQKAGIDIAGGRVLLLAFPRILGYVFNPISIWYAYGPEGTLRAVVHEVRNTFGDKHVYVVPIGADGLGHSFDKELHVSPFMDMTSRYTFSMNSPDRRLTVGIRQHDADGELFTASLAASATEMSDRNLIRLFVRHPLLTLKVIGGIHWEALRLWLKGVPFHSRPEPRSPTITVVPAPVEAA